MATFVYVCGLECGVAMASGHYAVNGTTSISTTTVRSGTRSMRCNPTASNGSVRNTAVHTSGTRHIGRFYIYFATLPNATTRIVRFGSGSDGPTIVYNNSDSKLYASVRTGGVDSFGASGVSVTTGQWYRIDYDFNVNTGGNDLSDAQVNGTALGQASGTGLSGPDTATEAIGLLDTCTGDMFIDDIAMSSTAADYPIGSGYVHPFIPTADGTHNIAGTGDFQRGNTGVDILNSTTTAYQLVDDAPPLSSTADSVDSIAAIAPLNATDYVECIFGPASGIGTPTTGPRGLDVIVTHHQAGTQTGNIRVAINDNGTTNDVLNLTAAGVTTARAAFKSYSDPPSAATAWHAANDGTDGDFRDLRFRFYSSDAAPDQFLNAVLIEAEFASNPTLTQAAFRFYEDGTESGSTAIDAQNTNITRNVDSDSNLQLRIRIQESGAVAGAGTDDYQLQYSLNGGSYTNVGSGAVVGFASANTTDGGATTNRLGAGSGSFVAGEVSEDGLVDDVAITASNYTEHLYPITVVAAQVTNGATLDFRLLYNNAVLNTYTVTPRITVQKTVLTKTLAALGVG